MKMFIKIGPELYSEFEYRIEALSETDDDELDDGGLVKSDTPKLTPTQVQLTKVAYDIVQETESSITSYGLKNYRKLWNEIKTFYIECGSAEVFDRAAYERGELMSSRGLKGLIWFRHKGVDYSFNEHPKFVFKGKTYEYHKHPVGG